ncbi:MAG: hypothetical protein JXA25_04690 [Anaerolineales bacterium]|nr:hypothetical protein [Anaerolineales bacterium]
MKQPYFLTRFIAAVYLFFLGWSLWELTDRASGTGGVLGIFSIGWTYALSVYYLVALILLVFLIWMLISPSSFLTFLRDNVERALQVLGLARWVLVLGLFSIPLLLFLGNWKEYFELPVFRQIVFITTGLLSGLMIPDREKRIGERLVLGLFLTTFVYLIVIKAASVVDYPFSLTWSEGNRFWDYSLIFAKSRYLLDSNFSLPTYIAPGRHGLWGLIFLFPNVSIQIVRLWDLIVWVVPGLLLGWALFSTRLDSSLLRRLIMILWVFLYLWQGPIYSPLLLSALLLVVMYSPQKLLRSAAGAMLACFYAGFSRWTWFVAPAIWVVLLDLFSTDPVRRWFDFWLRSRRALVLGGAGLLGGGAAWLGMRILIPRDEAIYATAMQQDFLQYRLWESATNDLGIVNSLLLAALPLLLLLILVYVRTKPKVDWLFVATMTVALAAMISIGLIASIKIGGGNNLHNLDMFLVTLVLLAMLFYPTWRRLLPDQPILQVLTLLIILIPVWFVSRSGKLPNIKPQAAVEGALTVIGQEVERAAQEGEVLFIDQRQLLTFSEVPRVLLVEEYELKDLMNQAMRRNQAYFEKFYDDLENHRFSLIISDPLPIIYKGSETIFGEENDLWVEQVSVPILQYYEPVQEFKGLGIWLLAPIDPAAP